MLIKNGGCGDSCLTPVHYSPTHGVHADLGFGRDKVHIPFSGQTTLNVFGNRHDGSDFRPSYENDIVLKSLGGKLKL